MVNISLLEKSIPVAPRLQNLRTLAHKKTPCHATGTEGGFSSCSIQTGVRFHNKSGLSFRGYSEDTFLIESKCPDLAPEKQKV